MLDWDAPKRRFAWPASANIAPIGANRAHILAGAQHDKPPLCRAMWRGSAFICGDAVMVLVHMRPFGKILHVSVSMPPEDKELLWQTTFAAMSER